ncbi:MAG: flagellar protein [Aeromonas sp.]
MLKSYLGLQQNELENLGKERQRLREAAIAEEQRAHRLKQVIDTNRTEMGEFHPLLWRNKLQMDGQLQYMLQEQITRSNESRIALQSHEKDLLKQLGRVKGLELLLTRREDNARAQQEKRDQHQLDELANLKFLSAQRG